MMKAFNDALAFYNLTSGWSIFLDNDRFSYIHLFSGSHFNYIFVTPFISLLGLSNIYSMKRLVCANVVGKVFFCLSGS